MPDKFAVDSFYMKKLCSRVISSDLWFFTQIGHFMFCRPPMGNLGTMYDDHLRLIGKVLLIPTSVTLGLW